MRINKQSYDDDHYCDNDDYVKPKNSDIIRLGLLSLIGYAYIAPLDLGPIEAILLYSNG